MNVRNTQVVMTCIVCAGLLCSRFRTIDNHMSDITDVVNTQQRVGISNIHLMILIKPCIKQNEWHSVLPAPDPIGRAYSAPPEP